jgi:hypothetical protein
VRKDACVTRVSVKRGSFDSYSVIGGSGIEIPVEIQSAPFIEGLESDETHKSGWKELIGNGLKAVNISGVLFQKGVDSVLLRGFNTVKIVGNN